MEAYPIPSETLWVPGPSATPCARADGATGDPVPSRNRNLKLKDSLTVSYVRIGWRFDGKLVLD